MAVDEIPDNVYTNSLVDEIPDSAYSSQSSSPDEIPDVKYQKSLVDSILSNFGEHWNRLKTGVQNFPLVAQLEDQIASVIAGRFPENTPRPSATEMLLSPFQIVGGAMGVTSPTSVVGEEVLAKGHEALGSPGGEWGETAARLLGGFAGGLPEASLLSKVGKAIPWTLEKKAGQMGLFKHMPESPGGVIRGETGPRGTAGTGEMVGIAKYTPEEAAKVKAIEKFLGRKKLTDEERDWGLGELAKLEQGAQYVVKEKRAMVRATEIDPFPGTPARDIMDQVGWQKELFDDLKRVPVSTENEKLHLVEEAYKRLTGKPVMSDLERVADPGIGMKLQNAFIKSTGLLVTAPQTGLRNFLQQGMRYGLEVPLRAMQEVYTTGSFENAWKKAASQLTSLYDYRQIPDELEHAISRLNPEQLAQLARRGMYEEYSSLKTPDWYDRTVGVVAQKANWFNQKQEVMYWNANFTASINGQLAESGMKLGRGVSAGQLPQKMIDEAFKHANEMTYSRTTKWSEEWGKALQIPGIGIVLNEAVPFFRFNFANALRDIIDFSPAGFVKASMSRNSDEAARLYAKSVMGTKIIEQVARMKEDAGMGVWEIRLPGSNQIIDARKWHPLDAYVILGEMINRPPNTPNSRVTSGDLASLALGGTRLEDTAVGIIASMASRGFEDIGDSLLDSAATWIGRWTTPAKWGQDAYALVTGDPKVMAEKDIMGRTFGGGLLDRAMANVPGLRQLLPDRIDPTHLGTPGPQNRLEYIQRLEGLEPVRSNYLKEELKRLSFTGPQGEEALNRIYDRLGTPQSDREGFKGSTSAGDFLRKTYASTGERELNRAANTLMRDVASPELMKLVQSPEYKNLPLEVRRVVMDSLLEELRKGTREASTSGLTPLQQLRLKLKELSPTERGVLDYATR